MALLERWRPKELDRLRSEMDDLLERFGFDRDWFGRFPFSREFLSESASARPAIETRVEDGKFIVRTDLPGIDPKDVDIKVVGGLLTIKGSREEKRRARKRTSSGVRSATVPSSVRSLCPRVSKRKI
jgi:HSP20 family protein